MRAWVRCAWITAGLVAAMVARAAEGEVSDKDRRSQLNADRAAAEARYQTAVTECERGFVVTSCVDRAKAERRATLDRVAREQAALDDAHRKRRAEERRQRVAEKQAQQAQQAAATERNAAASAPPAHVRTPPSGASAAKPGRRFEPRSADEAAAAQAEADRRAAQGQERHERAQAHEDAVRKRNAERAAEKPPAAPLPVPDAPPASTPKPAASAIR